MRSCFSLPREFDNRLTGLFVSDRLVWYKVFVPRDGTATRERILTSAEQLVIENGYAATSVDQVIAASGSSKGAFFHHFDSKLDLARSLVERYATADIGQLDAATEHARGITEDPAGRVDAFLAYFEDRADELMSV